MYNTFSKDSKQGITFITLLATIVIIIILASTVVISANDLIPKTQQKKFAKEIYMIQKKVEEYKFKNSVYPVEDTSINYTIPEEYSNQFSDETITDSVVELKPIDLYEADVETISFGNKQKGENDIYVLSEKTGKVYYLEGYKYKDQIYYTLTDELIKLLGVSNVK